MRTYFHSCPADADLARLLDPAQQFTTPWGSPDHGDCDKCGGEGSVAYECRSCLAAGADLGCPACTGRVRFQDVCPTCEGDGTIDRTRRRGIAVFPSEAGLYRYLAEREAQLDGKTMVELEGRLSDDRDLDADAGALLLHPTRIVAVHPFDRERIEKIAAGYPVAVPSQEASDRYAHRFGTSPPLSLGAEEELLLIDGRRRLVPASEAVLERFAAGPLADRVSSEIFSEQIELKTGICHGADGVLADLREARRAVREAGFELLGSGLHPSARSGEASLVAKPRYDVVREDLGSLLRTPPCGLHVHVGIPDADLAVRLANAFRLYLPVLQALSANSPFQDGVDSGHASARTSVVRSYPRFQVPRQFRDYEDFCHVADQLIAAAGVDDYTYIWWDVRPHPQLGTVEVRAVDVQTGAVGSTALAALIQAIAAKELEQPSPPDLSREALEESYFQAARHGLEAEILLDAETPEPARQAIGRMLESVRPYARELGGDAALEEIERVLREGNGADDQRRVHRQTGMDGLLEYVAARTH